MAMKKILQAVVPVLAIAAGVAVFRYLVSTRPAPERAAPTTVATPVRSMRATRGEHAIDIVGHGVVSAAREVVLAAELTGRVVARHPDLVPGGIVERGATLVRIDPRDFRTAIAQQEAQLETQRLQVWTEERRRAVAEREWQLLSSRGAAFETSPEGRALALREPQLRSAQAAIRAIDAQLAQARLTLSRTTLRAPFRALVREADVEVGQLVGPSARLAVLVDTAEFWVQVSLPFESIAPLVRTGPAGPAIDAPARVTLDVGERQVVREGRVVRLLGDLEPMGRMARVLVSIPDPMGLERSGSGELPLLLGSYVRVEIDAGRLHDVFEIPRTALREGDTVWLVEDGRLAVRPVTVVFRRDDAVLVSAGLEEGARIVVSPLASPVAGMDLRDVEASEASARGPTAAASPGSRAEVLR